MNLTAVEWVSLSFMLAVNAVFMVAWVWAMSAAVRLLMRARLLIRTAAASFRGMRKELGELVDDTRDVKGGLRIAGLDDTRPPVGVTPTDYL